MTLGEFVCVILNMILGGVVYHCYGCLGLILMLVAELLTYVYAGFANNLFN